MFAPGESFPEMKEREITREELDEIIQNKKIKETLVEACK